MKNVFDLNEDEKKAGVFCRVVREENEMPGQVPGCDNCSFGEFEFPLCDGCEFRNGHEGYYLTLADMDVCDIANYISGKVVALLDECCFLNTHGVRCCTLVCGALIRGLDCSLDEKVELATQMFNNIIDIVKADGE